MTRVRRRTALACAQLSILAALALQPAVFAATASGARATHVRHGGGDVSDVMPARTILPAGAKVSVPMDLATGQPVVEVMLNGRGPYRMFLDTGAGSTVLDRSLSEELGLRKVGETRIGDPVNPEAIAADLVMIDSLQIGDVRFEGVRAASWDRSELRRDTNPPRGVIGFAVFHELLLTLDYPESEVRIRHGRLPAVDASTVLRYTDSDGIPSVPLSVAGVPFVAHLDTGSPGFLSIPENASSGVRFAAPLRELGRGRTVNTEIVFRGAELDGDLMIGKHRFEHPMIMVNDRLPNANLGGRALRDFALTFDQRAKSVRFDRTRTSPPETFDAPTHVTRMAAPAVGGAPAAGPAPGEKSAGVMLSPQSDGSLIVVDKVPGSAAASSDIAPGDRVLMINGTPIGSLSHDERRAALHRSPVTLTLARGDGTFDVTLEF
jgi:predicted aspartyl protease